MTITVNTTVSLVGATQTRETLQIVIEQLVPLVKSETSADSGGTWGQRDGAWLGFINDTAFMIGGWAGGPYDANWGTVPFAPVTNQVYSSDDFGATWTRLRSHDITPDATHFTPRHWFSALVYNDQIYLLNGDTGDPNNGVINSDIRRSNDGITFTKINVVQPGFHGYFLTMCGELNGKLYVGGGHNDVINAASATSRVWESSDLGVTWIDKGLAPWPARGLVDRFVTHNGKLWLFGGGRHATLDANRVYYNDVWCSTDGTTWTQVLADGHSQWPGGLWQSALSHNDWMYISRGYNHLQGGNMRNTYRSRDGVTWEQANWPLEASHADSIAAHSTGVLVTTGNWAVTGSPPSNISPSRFMVADPDPLEGLIKYVQSRLTSEFMPMGNYLMDSAGQIVSGYDGSSYYYGVGGTANSKTHRIASATNPIVFCDSLKLRNSSGGYVFSTSDLDRVHIAVNGTSHFTSGATGPILNAWNIASFAQIHLANVNDSGSELITLGKTSDPTITPFWIQRFNASGQVDFWNSEAGDMRFATSNVHRMTIRSGGGLGLIAINNAAAVNNTLFNSIEVGGPAWKNGAGVVTAL